MSFFTSYRLNVYCTCGKLTSTSVEITNIFVLLNNYNTTYGKNDKKNKKLTKKKLATMQKR